MAVNTEQKGSKTQTQESGFSFNSWYEIQMGLSPENPLRKLAERAKDFLRHFPEFVIHEDSDLIVLNKPAGFPTDGTFCTITQLTQYAKENPNAFPVHRLDRDTSGLLVIGKNHQTRASMQRQFEKRSVGKRYVALVHGNWPQELAGIIAPMAHLVEPEEPNKEASNNRHMEVVAAEDAEERNAKYSASAFHTVAQLTDSQNDPWSLVDVRLHTGRTHQIRVHAEHLGFPIMGDRQYNSDSSGAPRQMLHAYKMSFRRPRSDLSLNDILTFRAPLPTDFRNALSGMQAQVIDDKLFHEITR